MSDNNSSYLASLSNATFANPLTQPCRESISKLDCFFANLAIIFGLVLWLAVPLPQILKNFYYKNVEGLSMLAIAWGSVGLVPKVYSVFIATHPIYQDIVEEIIWSYRLTMASVLLAQTWWYNKTKLCIKTVYCITALVLWVLLLTFEVTIPSLINVWYMIFVFFGPTQLLPQLYVNIVRGSATIQAKWTLIMWYIASSSNFIGIAMKKLPQSIEMNIALLETSIIAFNCVQKVYYAQLSRRLPEGLVNDEDEDDIHFDLENGIGMSTRHRNPETTSTSSTAPITIRPNNVDGNSFLIRTAMRLHVSPERLMTTLKVLTICYLLTHIGIMTIAAMWLESVAFIAYPIIFGTFFAIIYCSQKCTNRCSRHNYSRPSE